MSDTTTPTPAPQPMRSQPESLKSQTFIIGMYLITIGGIVVGYGMWKGDPAQISGYVNLMIGLTFGAVGGFFLGASKHPPTSTSGPTP
jgi:hypothetical protein